MIVEILNSYALNLDKVRNLVEDLGRDEMTAQPLAMPNHAAWTIGHLVYAAERIGGELGMGPWLAENWTRCFGMGSTPSGDPDAYPEKEALLRALDDAQRRVAERLRAMSEEDLSQPLPDARHRGKFPSLGHAVLHVLGSHTAVHVGQLTVWRRGIGPE